MTTEVEGERVHFVPGERIFAEGDISDHAYALESGEVEIYHEADGRVIRLNVLGAGDIFGEMGLVEERPRSASARALGPVRARRIDRDGFLALFYQEPDAVIPVIRMLFERLRNMNDRLIDALEHPADALSAMVDMRVRLVPLTPQMADAISVDGLTIDRFPFRVGRAPVGGEQATLDYNDLLLQDRVPFNLSRNHFAIERGARGFELRDRGSLFGTIVNGRRIGGMVAANAVILRQGPNEITAGRADSVFRFRLLIEPASAPAPDKRP